MRCEKAVEKKQNNIKSSTPPIYIYHFDTLFFLQHIEVLRGENNNFLSNQSHPSCTKPVVLYFTAQLPFCAFLPPPNGDPINANEISLSMP